MSQFELEILTPDKQFFSSDVDMLVILTTDGERGILARHMPTISTVDSGMLKIKKDGSEFKALVTEGLMYVTETKVTVTVDTAEWPEEIDKTRAEEALKRADGRLKVKEATDIERAKSARKRALARIKVSNISSGLSEEQKEVFAKGKEGNLV